MTSMGEVEVAATGTQAGTARVVCDSEVTRRGRLKWSR